MTDQNLAEDKDLDFVNTYIEEHLLIRDPESGKVFLNRREAKIQTEIAIPKGLDVR